VFDPFLYLNIVAIAYSLLLRLLGGKKFDLWYKIQACTVSTITILAAILVSANSNAEIQEWGKNLLYLVPVLAILWIVPRNEPKSK